MSASFESVDSEYQLHVLKSCYHPIPPSTISYPKKAPPRRMRLVGYPKGLRCSGLMEYSPLQCREPRMTLVRQSKEGSGHRVGHHHVLMHYPQPIRKALGDEPTYSVSNWPVRGIGSRNHGITRGNSNLESRFCNGNRSGGCTLDNVLVGGVSTEIDEHHQLRSQALRIQQSQYRHAADVAYAPLVWETIPLSRIWKPLRSRSTPLRR